MGEDAPVGWSRVAQDLAEAESPAVEPASSTPVDLLNRRVGYVTVRWAVVVFGAIGGAVIGVLVAHATVGREDPFGRVVMSLAYAGVGFLVGGVVGGLSLVAAWLRSR
jgi:hypothetical protein